MRTLAELGKNAASTFQIRADKERKCTRGSGSTEGTGE